MAEIPASNGKGIGLHNVPIASGQSLKISTKKMSHIKRPQFAMLNGKIGGGNFSSLN